MILFRYIGNWIQSAPSITANQVIAVTRLILNIDPNCLIKGTDPVGWIRWLATYHEWHTNTHTCICILSHLVYYTGIHSYYNMVSHSSVDLGTSF